MWKYELMLCCYVEVCFSTFMLCCVKWKYVFLMCCIVWVFISLCYAVFCGSIRWCCVVLCRSMRVCVFVVLYYACLLHACCNKWKYVFMLLYCALSCKSTRLYDSAKNINKLRHIFHNWDPTNKSSKQYCRPKYISIFEELLIGSLHPHFLFVVKNKNHGCARK